MMNIEKKKKTLIIKESNQNLPQNQILEFSLEELEQIKKCKTAYYEINCIISNIPSNIVNICFYTKFNLDIQQYLHPNIKYISLGNKFNQNIMNLPSNLEILQFGNDFNKSVDNLPFKIRMLFFGFSFNQNVDYLPEGLERLRFGHDFNQEVNNLPKSLKYVNFSYAFVGSIDGLAQNTNLEEIVFSERSQFNHEIKILPPNIKFISMPTRYYTDINIDFSAYPKLHSIRLFCNYPKNKLEEIKHLIKNEKFFHLLQNEKVYIYKDVGRYGISLKKFLKKNNND